MSQEKFALQTNILLHADDFFEAYRRCIKGECPVKDEFGRLKYSVINIPSIVNAAFACELYLKSILKKPVMEHDLKKLFETLEKNKQNEIRKLVNNQLEKQSKYSFDLCLERAVNIFVKWRYIYEDVHTDGFMGCFINEYLLFFQCFISTLKDFAYKNQS